MSNLIYELHLLSYQGPIGATGDSGLPGQQGDKVSTLAPCKPRAGTQCPSLAEISKTFFWFLTGRLW